LGEEPTFDLQPTDPVPDGLLPALRLLQLGGQDAFLLEATFRDQILSIVENPISKENEAAVYEYMLDGCRQILSGYSTSSDEERSVLQSNDSTLAQRTASLITLGEKQSLRATMDEFEAQLGRLDSLEYYQERRLRELGLMDEEGDRVPLDPFREIENSM
jgi:[ribulose-bisphosphate carboxylase]-lysine N-methyltransferase